VAAVVESTWVAGVDGHVEPELATCALLIIDTQVDFVDGGASPIEGTTAILPALASLRTAFLRASRPVVHVVRLYEGDDVDRVRRTAIAAGARVVVPGSYGSQVVPELRELAVAAPEAGHLLAGELEDVGPHEVVMWKPRWSAFHRTRLHEYLTGLGVSTVVVAGCNFPNCPRATIYDSSAHDYRVLVPSDAVSGATALHLDELGKIGVLHASTATITAALDQLPNR
jgi:nicotinamidase-related amidase